MIILVNAFAILSLALYAWGKITPVAFILNSVLWMTIMVSVWFILPLVIYRRTQTFKHRFTMHFYDNDFTLEYTKGRRNWAYSSLKFFKETPRFFHLYFDERSFLLVPKDGFKNYDDIHSLRALLKSKVG